MNAASSDRSWNDPPIVKYDISGPAKKHHLLKKRLVEIDDKLQASSVGNTKEESEDYTPQNIDPVISEEYCEKSEGLTDKCNAVLPLSDDERLAFVLNTLQAILDEDTDKCEKSTKDVNKRIEVMKDSWKTKLSEEVKNKMFELTQELKNGNIDAALKIHWSLMMENVREVKSWMVGVKHIIEIKKEIISLDKIQSSSS